MAPAVAALVIHEACASDPPPPPPSPKLRSRNVKHCRAPIVAAGGSPMNCGGPQSLNGIDNNYVSFASRLLSPLSAMHIYQPHSRLRSNWYGRCFHLKLRSHRALHAPKEE